MSIKDQLRIIGDYLEIKRFYQDAIQTEVLKLQNIEEIAFFEDRKCHLVLKCKLLNKNDRFNEICLEPDDYKEAFNLIINALGSLSKTSAIVPDDYETKSM